MRHSLFALLMAIVSQVLRLACAQRRKQVSFFLFNGWIVGWGGGVVSSTCGYLLDSTARLRSSASLWHTPPCRGPHPVLTFENRFARLHKVQPAQCAPLRVGYNQAGRCDREYFLDNPYLTAIGVGIPWIKA